jgi:hypothetical protein
MIEQLAKPKRIRLRVKPMGANAAKRVDGRTSEARMMRRLRADLVAHVGDHPSTAQMILIETAARLQMHLAVMDRKFMENGDMTPFDSKRYTAWANTLTRTLVRLGLKGAAAAAPTLAEHLAGRAATPTSALRADSPPSLPISDMHPAGTGNVPAE